MSKIERDKVYYGEVTLLSNTQDIEIEKTRSILFTKESLLKLDTICEDIFYDSPKYQIMRDFYEARRRAIIFSKERIYVLRTISLYHLLRYFGFSENLSEADCIAMKENLFNGVFAYENSELFGYKRITNTYWENGILKTNEEVLENDKYDLLSYEQFAENDLTPYFQILNKIPYQNPEEAFLPFEEEGIIRKRILTGKEEK